MRVFVTGMHRSGTSALARLLNLMGCHLGDQDELIPPKPDNPAGFWEREDVRELNDDILSQLGGSWHTVCQRDLNAVVGVERRQLLDRAAAIVTSLDQRKPWLIKDPRLCRTLPLWREVVDQPVVVAIRRRPLEVARSLKARNGFTLSHGIALWEDYSISLAVACEGIPRHSVAHSRLMSEPARVAGELLDWLQEAGVTGVQAPSEAELSQLIRSDLVRAHADDESERPFLNHQREQLLASLQTGQSIEELSSLVLSQDSSDVLALHGRVHSLESECSEAFKERDAHFAHEQELLSERAELALERDSLAELAGRLKSQRDALAADKNVLLKQVQSLNGDLNTLFKEKSTALDQVREITTDRDALWAEKNDFIESSARVGHELLECRDENTRLSGDNDELRSRLEAVTRQLEEVVGGRAYRFSNTLAAPWRALRRLFS